MPSGPSIKVIIPLLVACALFMDNLDSTIIATALPAIAQSMHEDPLRLNLAITSYLLSLAIFIPMSGWMADRFGGRSVFRSAIVVFMVGSILCGISNGLGELVVARILQGMGGAMMVPVGRILLLQTIPKSDLIRSMSVLTMPALIGPVVGPPLGGFIVTYASWRWIFYINIPIAVIGILLVTLFVENKRDEKVPPLDLPGFVLSGIGLAALVYGFENVGRGILPGGVVATLLIGGTLVMGAYVWHARHTAFPIVDLSLLKIPSFRASTTGGSMFRIGIGALPFLMPLMLQISFGLSPFSSGLITFATAAGAMTMRFTATRIIRILGYWPVLVGDAVIASCFVVVCGFFRPSTPHWVIIAVLLAGGFFRSLQFTCTNTLNYADVPPALMSRASSFASMAQQLSVSVGVGLAAVVLHLAMVFRGGSGLTPEDFTVAFAVVGGISMLSTVVFLRLPRDVGSELSGHRAPTLTKEAAD